MLKFSLYGKTFVIQPIFRNVMAKGKETSGGYVYLLCNPSNDTFKIGVTKNEIEKRIKQLETGNDEDIFIASYHYTQYPYRLEKMLHTHFTTYHVNREWFKFTDCAPSKLFDDYCKEFETSLLPALLENECFTRNIR